MFDCIDGQLSLDDSSNNNDVRERGDLTKFPGNLPGFIDFTR